jgi:UDP-N-acetylmuramate dehydrogenase
MLKNRVKYYKISIYRAIPHRSGRMNTESVYQQLQRYMPAEALRLDEPMKGHTSFKIGGSADIMVLPSKVEDIIVTVEICRQNNCPFFIMGNGTNLLVKDGGYRGVIIKTSANMNGFSIDGENVTGQAGILLSNLSNHIAAEGLEGFEFASGIPGSLGGAVTMNAGAYDGEMKDVVEWAKVVTPDGDIKIYSNDRLEFGYRSSIVQKEDLIVLECCLKLCKGDKGRIEEKIREYTRLRRAKQPLQYPSAGSTFKRPEGYYAGKLIEEAGLRGKRIGGAQVSEQHCGFIINVDNATAADVIALINHIKEQVMARFGVELQPEVKIIGED